MLMVTCLSCDKTLGYFAAAAVTFALMVEISRVGNGQSVANDLLSFTPLGKS